MLFFIPIIHAIHEQFYLQVVVGGGRDVSGGVGGSLPVMVFVMTKMVKVEGKPAVQVSSSGYFSCSTINV